MKVPQIVGRILFGIPFAGFGIQHFLFAGKMAGMVPPYMPGGILWIYVTGAVLILSALSIVTKKYIVPASLILGAMLLGFILMIHLPNIASPNVAMRSMALAGLLKDTSLMGGAVLLAGFFSNSVKKKLPIKAKSTKENEEVYL